MFLHLVCLLDTFERSNRNIRFTEHTSAVSSESNCESDLDFVEIDHEIISMVILILPLIQEGLLSVTSERMCTKYWLTA